LPLSTPDTLGGQTLVSKCCPWPEILASLAPLDLQSCGGDDPDVDIAHGAQSLVLCRNYGIPAHGGGTVGSILFVMMVGEMVVGEGISWVMGVEVWFAASVMMVQDVIMLGSERFVVLGLVLLGLAAGAVSSTHDAASHAILRDTLFGSHVEGEVDKGGEFRYGAVLHFFNVPLKLGRNWGFKWHALAFGELEIRWGKRLLVAL